MSLKQLIVIVGVAFLVMQSVESEYCPCPRHIDYVWWIIFSKIILSTTTNYQIKFPIQCFQWSHFSKYLRTYMRTENKSESENRIQRQMCGRRWLNRSLTVFGGDGFWNYLQWRRCFRFCLKDSTIEWIY